MNWALDHTPIIQVVLRVSYEHLLPIRKFYSILYFTLYKAFTNGFIQVVEVMYICAVQCSKEQELSSWTPSR